MKILVFCAKGFETMEFSVFIDVMGWARNDYDALAIPGGFEEFGFYDEAYNPKLLQLIKGFDSQKKPIASICVGALPLGKSGVLNNRNATTYHLKNAYRQRQLAEFGVNVLNERIVVDDNIITSYCPETAPYVAFELLKKLCGEEKMLIVKKLWVINRIKFISCISGNI